MADDSSQSLGHEDAPRPDRDPEPPPSLSIRVKPHGARGLNKPAIVAIVGGATTLVLVLSAMGLGARPGGAPDERRPLMSDPARPEMAQGRVRDLPQSYDDMSALTRQNDLGRSASESIPELGAPMAGDIAAIAPDGVSPAYDPAAYGAHPIEPASAGGGRVTPVSTNAGPSEGEQALRSGLFFQLHERVQDGAQPQAAAEPEDNGEDRAAMTSPHRLMAPVSRTSLNPGTIIPASLITAINSEAPGPVIAQVTQGVYDSATGDRLLIPQGARLIGNYRSANRYGQTRIAITWSRLVLQDGRQIVLDELAVDGAGSSGAAGDVDNHRGEVFGAAALGTLINMTAAATEDPNSISLTSGGVGVVEGDDPVEQSAREGVQRAASAVSGRVVERGLSVLPIIRIAAGARISALVSRALAF